MSKNDEFVWLEGIDGAILVLDLLKLEGKKRKEKKRKEKKREEGTRLNWAVEILTHFASAF